LTTQIAQSLREKFNGAVSPDQEFRGEQSFTVSGDRLLEVAKFLSLLPENEFDLLEDLCGVDYPEREKRFEAVYHLFSVKGKNRLRLRVPLDGDNPVAPSVMEIWKAADWFEREVWDFFGIPFSGHPDLRRILTDYGFEGHPLRKDFPMTGFVEVRYDDALKRVVNEPVRLTQEYRSFDFLSPWEGDTPFALPGDEKAREG